MQNQDELPFELTEHAREVLAAREIPLAWVRRVLERPELRRGDPLDSELEHAIGRIEDYGGRALRVVYNRTKTPWRIVTVFFDRREGRRK